MGQLSAELNYERRLERYEEEAEELILNSENWEDELKHYLEEAGERQEQKEEEPRGGFNEEHEDYSIMLVAANLSENEKSEWEARGEEGHKIETSEGLVLLEKPEEKEESEEGVFPALEMGNYLLDLVVEGIELPVEESSEVEKPESREEDVDKELSREEKRQEELGKEELFEEFTRSIEAESEKPLERIFEGCERLEEIGKPTGELGVYEKPMEEYNEPREELREDFELLGESVEHERPMEELEKEGVEELVEESVEEAEEYGRLEGEVVEYERPGEELEELMERFEEYEGELEASEEFEAGEAIEEAGEEVVEETGEAEAGGEGVEEEAIEEREEVAEEAVGEEAGEGETVEVKIAEEGEEGGSPEGPSEIVAAGEEEGPEKEFELKDFTAGEEKLSLRGKKLKQGLHWARAVRDDGKVVEFTINVEREADKIRIPKDLKGKRVKELAIYKYDRDQCFPRFFKILGHSLHFNPVAKKLILDGREIGLEKIQWELEKIGKRKAHGPFATVTTSLKSIKAHGGHRLQLRLYQDGTVNIRDPSGQTRAIRKLEIEGNLLRLRYYRYEPEFPLYTQKLEDGVKYDVKVDVKGKTVIYPVEKLKGVFGHENVEELQKRIAKDEVALIAYFDKGKSCCRNKELVLSVPKGSETLEQIEVLPTEILVKRKAAELLSNYNKVTEGEIGEFLTGDKYREIIREKASELLGVLKEKLEVMRPGGKGPDYLIKDKDTGEVLAILDVKSTIRPDVFENPGAEKVVLDQAVNQLTGYMKEEKYKCARFALIARDYYDPWETLKTGGGIKRFKLIKMSGDGRMETIFEDEESD